MCSSNNARRVWRARLRANPKPARAARLCRGVRGWPITAPRPPEHRPPIRTRDAQKCPPASVSRPLFDVQASQSPKLITSLATLGWAPPGELTLVDSLPATTPTKRSVPVQLNLSCASISSPLFFCRLSTRLIRLLSLSGRRIRATRSPNSPPTTLHEERTNTSPSIDAGHPTPPLNGECVAPISEKSPRCTFHAQHIGLNSRI